MNPKVKLLVAIALIAGSIVWLVVSFRPNTRRLDLDLSTAVGEVVADQTGKLLNGHGQVLVIAWETQHVNAPVPKAELSGFLKPAPN